jgi:RNA polymerase sigma factor (sigma-70 family)
MARVQVAKHFMHGAAVITCELSDEKLLEQFLTCEETLAHVSFQALVKRYGPMVLAICRNVLGQEADAEDAFQATFLVLTQKAAAILNRTFPAAWFYEGAYRIAVKAQNNTVRRRSLERQIANMLVSMYDPNEPERNAARNELRMVLHEELRHLPKKYRLPVILGCLEGKSNAEVAAILEWPVGTVKGRLSRARKLLRSRLMRRGIALSAAILMTVLTRAGFAEAVPAELVMRTVRLARSARLQSFPVDPRSGTSPESSELSVPAGVELMAKTASASRKLGMRGLVFLILVILIAAIIGVALAARRGLASPFPRSGASAVMPLQSNGLSCQ